MMKLICLAAVLAVTGAQIFHSCEIMQLVCGSMFDPGSNLQNSTGPYSIVLSKYTAAPNDVVTVTLRGEIDFKGIFVQGRRDNLGSDETPLGNFQTPPPDGPNILLCDCAHGEENAALYINPFEPLMEVNLQYIVPANEPEIYLRASMSWNGSIFWHVHSDMLTVLN